ncbi:hypothetical protein FOQG_10952 [Fusarium oxysporum f. sp. raphani 54005]|uniref:Uncharacterized protein n=2 Tax=Fusarium oxysporum TaxID=5507 RepID=X0CR70_FUSOX|nr:hypothetical protein FOVG_03907 [Fusarium oxysporum f. sp. pisi HDV247]EXK85002.1 hypothetical protein FOQG_10952 [Fusarium oxysporum f. sp. raphani 54005]
MHGRGLNFGAAHVPSMRKSWLRRVRGIHLSYQLTGRRMNSIPEVTETQRVVQIGY